MKTLALVTMVFLPPTAVATIFQMLFFNWEREGSASIVNDRFWIYCITAVPLTIATLTVWWIWSPRQEKFKTKWHSLKFKFTDRETNQTTQKNLQGIGEGNERGETEWEKADGHAAAL
jgi:hypothetical protein